MFESQHGAVCYRLHPANPQIVQEQPGKGLHWRTHSRWVTPELAQDELWRLTRGRLARPMQPGLCAPLLHGPSAPLRVPLDYKVHVPQVYGNASAPAQADPLLLAVELYRLIKTDPQQQRVRLTWDADLGRCALLRVAQIRDRDAWAGGHTDADGMGPNYWLRVWGIQLPDWYDSANDANNVESLRLGPPDPADVRQAAWDSPHHRDHVFGYGFFGGQTRIGVGCCEDWDNPPQQWIWSVLICHER